MTLLFDDTKLEKTLGEEAAGVLIKIFEDQEARAKQELATKQDLRELELRLEYRLTMRLGAIAVSAIAIVAAIVKFLAK